LSSISKASFVIFFLARPDYIREPDYYSLALPEIVGAVYQFVNPPRFVSILLGIDLPKNVFQLCTLNPANKVVFNRTIRRARLHSAIAQLEPITIAMEEM